MGEVCRKSNIMKFILSFLGVAIALNLFAQDSFSEMMQFKDSKLEKINELMEIALDEKAMPGFELDITKVEMKKVALVAFSAGIAPELKDPNAFLSNGDLGKIALEFYKAALPALQKSFADQNIEFITKEKMTSEQQHIVQSFNKNDWNNVLKQELSVEELEYDFEKFESGIFHGIAVDGYRNVKFSKEDNNCKIARPPFADLAKALNVDAVLIVSIQVGMPGQLVYKNTTMSLIGKNPVYPDDNFKSLRSKGLVYSQICNEPKSPFALGAMKMGNVDIEKFSEYDKLVKYASDKMLQYYFNRKKELQSN